MGEEESGRNVRGVRGCFSLAIVWTQCPTHCIDHRQGVAEGAEAGRVGMLAVKRGGGV